MNAMLRAIDARDPGGQERLMLKEVEMPPRLLLGVVHLALGRSHSGQANRAPFAKSSTSSSRRASRSKLTPTTPHGS